MSIAKVKPQFGPSKLQNTQSRLKLVANGILQFDAAQWQPGSAVRCAIGVAIPVIVADVSGHTSWGALAGLGALYAGLSSYRGVYRKRIWSMLLTVLVTALMTAIGCLVGQSPALTLTVIPAIAFVAALYATSSQIANSLATQAVCVLVVLDGLRLGPSGAIGDAGLVMSGGLVQTFLLTFVWPVNPRYPERKAISDAFLSLAEFFRQIPTGSQELIPGTQRFEDARSVLREARDFRWRAEHELLVELMRSGETLRAASVGFAQATESLDEAGCESATLLCQRIYGVMKLVSARVLAGKFGELNHVGDDLPEIQIDDPELRHWYGIIKERLSNLDHKPPHILDDPMTPNQTGSGWRWLFTSLTKLPSVGSLQQVAINHAIRYSVTLAAALAVTQVWRQSHLYWLPLTVAIVLRADFATTAIRGAGRLLGTLLGVGLASAVLVGFHPSPNWLSALTLFATWFCFALIQPNYALYSVAITLYVVFSVSSAGVSHHGLALMRLLATLAGSALSVAAYVLWPSFQGRQLHQVIVDALSAQINFGEHVKTDSEPKLMDETRNQARQMRIKAETLFQTAALEPWGVKPKVLADARSAIILLDENAADLLASRVDTQWRASEIDRVLSSSRKLRDRLQVNSEA